MPNHAQSPAGPTRPPTQTARQALVEMIDRTDLTVTEAGGSWPDWSTKTSGYNGQACTVVDTTTYQYSLSIQGNGSPDPARAAQRMTTFWKSKGWSVRTVVPVQPSNADFTQIAVDFPDEGSLGFSVSRDAMTIDAQSPCSSDPDMLQTSK